MIFLVKEHIVHTEILYKNADINTIQGEAIEKNKPQAIKVVVNSFRLQPKLSIWNLQQCYSAYLLQEGYIREHPTMAFLNLFNISSLVDKDTKKEKNPTKIQKIDKTLSSVFNLMTIRDKKYPIYEWD